MFHLSDTNFAANNGKSVGRERAHSIEQTDMDMFSRIWNQAVVKDWILDKSDVQPWLLLGIICSGLLSLLLFINICIWAATDKVGLFWIIPFLHWMLVGPFWASRFLMDFDHNRLLICREYGLSPLWFDFFGVPTARVYLQENEKFPCNLYRLETEFKTYPSIVFLMCGVAIHNSGAILEGICVTLCLICISCERLMLMRVARYPSNVFVDVINGIETFSDCYLRTSSIVLFAFSTGDVTLLVVLPVTLYMFSTVCALAIFLEQKDKRTLTTQELRSLFVKSLYYAIPGTIAGYNFSVHLTHTYDRTQAVEHLKSVVIEATTRIIMALMFTRFALDDRKDSDVWDALFWTMVVLFFTSVLLRFIEVNVKRRRDRRQNSQSDLFMSEERRPSSARIISKGDMLNQLTPPPEHETKREPLKNEEVKQLPSLHHQRFAVSNSSLRHSNVLNDFWDRTPRTSTGVVECHDTTPSVLCPVYDTLSPTH